MEENPMIARVALHGMCQDNNEPIRSFSVWIQGQAGVCKYNVTCRLPRLYSERCPGSWDLRPRDSIGSSWRRKARHDPRTDAQIY